jgi:hypothetical protein
MRRNATLNGLSRSIVADKGKSLMRKVTDVEVWRAANQLITRFQDPEMEAAQRADAAYAAGDMFNFDLWTRINTAVQQLLLRSDGKSAN